jgi:hypothetical protein
MKFFRSIVSHSFLDKRKNEDIRKVLDISNLMIKYNVEKNGPLTQNWWRNIVLQETHSNIALGEEYQLRGEE